MRLSTSPAPTRRALLLLALLSGSAFLTAGPAVAATVAESFVGENIGKGLDILRDKKLTTVQRRDQFETLLLGLVDVRRIGLFTLGQYRRPPTPPEDVEAFLNAFKNYATAAYQSYFARYTNQTLKVTGSTQRTPTDFIVQTLLIDPNSSQQPSEVDFRVRTDTGKSVLVDVAYQGIWLSLEERDQFVAFLGQNNGNVRTLIAHLSELAVNLGKPTQ